MSYKIPFNRPCLVGNELEYIGEAIRNGHVSGDGPFSRKCHEQLEKALGVPKVFLTTSCTHALEMSALLLDIQPGDEVIVPSFTFVTTVNAFVLRGARPVFVDIRPDTLNIDETLIEPLISPKTRAIVIVNYAGVGCEMDAILEISRRHGIPVVEDNAHGLFGRYKGRKLGTFGVLSTLSFHETKNIICGEGGALVVNDEQYTQRAEFLREKGTNRSQFFRGKVEKYIWVDVGSSYLPSDILAAFLFAQLEACDRIQAERKRIWEYYHGELSGWAEQHDIRLPVIPDHCEHPYHMFHILLHDAAQRTRLIDHLKERGILSVFHYQPLHMSEMGAKLAGVGADCPVTVDVSDRLLRLPFYNELSEADQAYVVASIKEFYS